MIPNFIELIFLPNFAWKSLWTNYKIKTIFIIPNKNLHIFQYTYIDQNRLEDLLYPVDQLHQARLEHHIFFSFFFL
jgi:hypothetical protein